MATPRPNPGRGPAKSARKRKAPPAARNMDIAPILAGWDYEGGTVSVRKIIGLDGREKLQMRLDLGVLQMELAGRPDGRRPHNLESLLEYHERRLARHLRSPASTPRFFLDAAMCRALRDEAVLYDQRYLALFVLGDFAGVLRDTGRNLRLLDLCAQYAIDDHDRLVLEQYRPYMIMMQTRAQASIEFHNSEFKKSLETIAAGVDRIREFFVKFGQDDAIAKSSEVALLKSFAQDVSKKVPVDPMIRLREKLELAIKRENYEEAARLRDRMTLRKEKPRASRDNAD